MHKINNLSCSTNKSCSSLVRIKKKTLDHLMFFLIPEVLSLLVALTTGSHFTGASETQTHPANSWNRKHQNRSDASGVTSRIVNFMLNMILPACGCPKTRFFWRDFFLWLVLCVVIFVFFVFFFLVLGKPGI